MTKEDFLIVSDLLTGYDFDELDKVEFFMVYEQKSNTKIPDEWFAEAELPKHETKTDWSSFRREAAKDILAGMMSNVPLSEYGITDAECMAEYAVLYAEKLIKRLKEDGIMFRSRKMQL